MGKLKRDGRVIVAEGGSCPSLERLSNGDLLVAYRDDTLPRLGVSVTRSTDGGRTWRKEHTFAYGASAERTDDQFYGHHGMAQLADGTILLPYNVYGSTYSGVYNRTVCVRKSVDQGHSWSEPIVVIPGPGPAAGWAAAASYGKIRTLHDGTVILPIIGRSEGDRFGRHGYLTSHDGGETWDGYGDRRLRPILRRRGRLPAAALRPHPVREPRSVQHPRARCRAAVLQLERRQRRHLEQPRDGGLVRPALRPLPVAVPHADPAPSSAVTGTWRRWTKLHIGSVAFCYVKEEGLDWSGETHIWGGAMYLSFLMQFHAMGQGYPSFAYARDDRILVVHHNQPLPAVGERDIEGVFYVEQDEDPAWRGDVG